MRDWLGLDESEITSQIAASTVWQAPTDDRNGRSSSTEQEDAR
jgi:hypothetical protein